MELRVLSGESTLFGRFYEAQGRTLGSIVLVHGLGEHSGRYEHLANCSSERGYQVAAVDLRGHGRSSGPRGHASISQLGDDLTALLGHLEERLHPGPRFLYGHSMGGAVALAHAARYPGLFRGVVASSPGLLPAAPVPSWKRVFGRACRLVHPAKLMTNGLDVTGLSRDPNVVEAYLADPWVHPFVSVQLGLDILSTGKRILRGDVRPGCPVLLMHGSEDRLTSPAGSSELAEVLGSMATIRNWPGLYHELHNEPEREEVLDHALSWMDSLASHAPASSDPS